MQIAADQFETYETLIRSDQVPVADVMALMRENPEFKSWYTDRVQRRAAAWLRNNYYTT